MRLSDPARLLAERRIQETKRRRLALETSWAHRSMAWLMNSFATDSVGFWRSRFEAEAKAFTQRAADCEAVVASIPAPTTPAKAPLRRRRLPKPSPQEISP